MDCLSLASRATAVLRKPPKITVLVVISSRRTVKDKVVKRRKLENILIQLQRLSRNYEKLCLKVFRKSSETTV